MDTKLYPHRNDCETCEYLGNDEAYDLYYCTKQSQHNKWPLVVAVNQDRELIARTTEEADRYEPLQRALKLANEQDKYLHEQSRPTGP